MSLSPDSDALLCIYLTESVEVKIDGEKRTNAIPSQKSIHPRSVYNIPITPVVTNIKCKPLSDEARVFITYTPGKSKSL